MYAFMLIKWSTTKKLNAIMYQNNIFGFEVYEVFSIHYTELNLYRLKDSIGFQH